MAALFRSGKIVLMIFATIPDVHACAGGGVVNPSLLSETHPVVDNKVSFCPFLPSCSQIPYQLKTAAGVE